jgi:hypothetical protein
VFSSVLQQPNNYTTNYNLSYTKSHHDSPTDAPSLQRRRRSYIEYINAISFYLNEKKRKTLSLSTLLSLSFTQHTRETHAAVLLRSRRKRIVLQQKLNVSALNICIMRESNKMRTCDACVPCKCK